MRSRWEDNKKTKQLNATLAVSFVECDLGLKMLSHKAASLPSTGHGHSKFINKYISGPLDLFVIYVNGSEWSGRHSAIDDNFQKRQI